MSQGSTTGSVSVIQVIDAIPTDGSNNPVSSNGTFDALALKDFILTFPTGLTRTTNTVTNNLSTGISGSQSVIGGTAASETLTLSSTSNATKGKLLFGTSAYDEVNNYLGITNTTPTSKLHIITDALGTTRPPDSSGLLLENTTLSTAGTYQNSPSLVFASHGWGLTTFDRLVKWKIYSSPIYGSNTEVLPSLKFDFSIAGGAYVSSGLSLDRDRFGSFTLNSCPISTTGFSSNGTASMLLGNSANATAALIAGGNAYSYLGGETARATVVQQVTVASGTGIYNAIGISGAINQTGTASGITRGFYHNPTLTAAVDYRAIESTNGKVLLTDTFSAVSGALAGSLLDLRQTWNTTGSPTAIKLNVTNTTSGASSLLMDLQANGNSYFRVGKNGDVSFGNQNVTIFAEGGGSPSLTGLNMRLQSNRTLATGGDNYAFVPALANNATSGTVNGINNASSFAPSSGTGIFNAFNFSSTINQTGGASGITRGLYINPTLTSAFDFRAIEVTGGKIVYSSTITAAGTTGAQTINKISGKVNAAAASTSLVVTNSLVTASSIVMCQLGTNDATCDIKSVVEAAGSFTINYTAPTAETVIKFTVIN